MDFNRKILELKEEAKLLYPFEIVEFDLVANNLNSDEEIKRIVADRHMVLDIIEKRVRHILESFPIKTDDIVVFKNGVALGVKSIKVHSISKKQPLVDSYSREFNPIEIAELRRGYVNYRIPSKMGYQIYKYTFKGDYFFKDFEKFYDDILFSFEKSGMTLSTSEYDAFRNTNLSFSNLQFSEIERFATNEEKDEISKRISKYDSNGSYSHRISYRDAYGKDEWSDTSYSS